MLALRDAAAGRALSIIQDVRDVIVAITNARFKD